MCATPFASCPPLFRNGARFDCFVARRLSISWPAESSQTFQSFCFSSFFKRSENFDWRTKWHKWLDMCFIYYTVCLTYYSPSLFIAGYHMYHMYVRTRKIARFVWNIQNKFDLLYHIMNVNSDYCHLKLKISALAIISQRKPHRSRQFLYGQRSRVSYFRFPSALDRFFDKLLLPLSIEWKWYGCLRNPSLSFQLTV